MKSLASRRIILPTSVVFLIALIALGISYKDKIWSVAGQHAFQVAKVRWAEGERQEAIEFWFYGIDRTLRDSINRERAYSRLRRSDNFLEEGKLSEALDTCHEAETIYNEEGEITYHCLVIEERISETVTPVP